MNIDESFSPCSKRYFVSAPVSRYDFPFHHLSRVIRIDSGTDSAGTNPHIEQLTLPRSNVARVIDYDWVTPVKNYSFSIP